MMCAALDGNAKARTRGAAPAALPAADLRSRATAPPSISVVMVSVGVTEAAGSEDDVASAMSGCNALLCIERLQWHRIACADGL